MTALRRRLHPLDEVTLVPPEEIDFCPTAPLAVARLVTDDGPVVIKRRTGHDGERLELEVEILRTLPDSITNSATVRLVKSNVVDDTVEVTYADAGASTLGDAGEMPHHRVLKALISACQALDALHRHGWSHGNLVPEHVVVGGRGSARLCSLAAARPLIAQPDGLNTDLAAMRAIIFDVGTLLADRNDKHTGPLSKALRVASQSTATSAAELGESVSACAQQGNRTHKFGNSGVIAIAAVLAVGISIAGRSVLRNSGQNFPRNPADAVALTSRSAPPTISIDGRKIRVGQAGDIAAIADLSCTGRPGLVLLRPKSGEIFIASKLPRRDAPIRLSIAGRHPGAHQIVVGPATRPSLCQRVTVRISGQPDLIISGPAGNSAPQRIATSPTAPPPDSPLAVISKEPRP